MKVYSELTWTCKKLNETTEPWKERKWNDYDTLRKTLETTKLYQMHPKQILAEPSETTDEKQTLNATVHKTRLRPTLQPRNFT